jgi:hypothetical protein
MKLSDHLVHIQQAFDALMSSIEDINEDFQYQPGHGHRIRRDLPRYRDPSVIPRIPPIYPPPIPEIGIDHKKTLLLLAAVEATYHNNITPISPDMHPLVIDTGASITVTPYLTDFISPLKPVQSIEIKGIASGLMVKGYGMYVITSIMTWAKSNNYI